MINMRSVGVEEELLLVEPGSGQPRAVAGSVMRAVREAGPESGRDTEGEAGGDEWAGVQPAALATSPIPSLTVWAHGWPSCWR
jgi:hypothetical protein